MGNTASILIFFLVLLPASSAGADQLQDGIDAYFKGNNTQAIGLLRPLAEQGYADAQYYLGIMHQRGQGLQQDYTQAALWYRKAAEQGNTMAQAGLSNLYVTGRGVSQNYVLGYIHVDQPGGSITSH
jgi:TPR repeat protein